MRACLLLVIGMCAIPLLQAQDAPVSTVRGSIVDGESQFPLPTVKVYIYLDSVRVIGALSDNQGEYRLENVPVGRRTVNFQYLGYQPVVLNNIEVNSGREVILNVEMQSSSMEMDTVLITGRRSGEVANEMATVSAREFSVTETNLYAGSRGEPARMASNYAGVQGADDSRNDIIVRGNSPQGVLWRLDGVNIPNPNHFSIPGTGGGPVTILNNKFLANSDFFTGAFPAEYGNGVAGVFDLKMRNGNNERYEFSGQLGFLGTEFTAEGPFTKKSKASFLVMYRYSTLSLFGFLGINVGSNAIPAYQDGAFRINIPFKNGAKLAFWGIGGLSNVDILISDQEAPSTVTDIYASNDRDQYFGSNMGVAGMNYIHPISMNSFVKASVAVSHQSIDANHNQVFRRVDSTSGNFLLDSLPPILDYTFRQNKISSYLVFNQKIGRQHTIRAGAYFDWYDMRFIDSVRVVNPATDSTAASLLPWTTRWNANQGAGLLQPFIQYKLRWQDKLTFTLGVSSLLWTLNKNSFSPIEPRVGLSYNVAKGHKLNLGGGLHSQIQSPYLYFYGQENVGGVPQEHNRDMGLTKSVHAVGGWDWLFAQDFRLRAEVYYQYLYDIPVRTATSSFSLINSGSGFSRLFPDTLMNGGTARNFGFELTVEKFFSKNWYFLFTGSVFDAKYRGSDDVLRNVSFNGRYAVNALFAKEFNIKKKHTIQIGGKFTSVGGRWYGPPDSLASAQALEVIYTDSTVNTWQFRPYIRADIKLLYRFNARVVTHEIGVDLVNAFNIKNLLTLTWAPDHPSGIPIQEEYQLGFLPLFYYKVDFSIGRRKRKKKE